MAGKPFCLKQLLLWGVLSALMLTIPTQAGDSPLERDSRLAQLVSLCEARMTLREALQRLEKATGVSMQASPELAPRGAIVCVQKRPLRALMTHLATAFHAEWRANTENPPAYTLYPLPARGGTTRPLPVQERREDVSLRLRALYDPFYDTKDGDEYEAYRELSQRERLPFQALKRLTPAELGALRAGKPLELSSRTDPRFAPEWLADWKKWLADTVSYYAEASSTPKGNPEQLEYYLSVMEKDIARGDEIRLRVAYDPQTGAVECAVGLFGEGALLYGETFRSEEEPPTPEGFLVGDYSVSLPSDHPWRGVDFEPLWDDSEGGQEQATPAMRRIARPALPALNGDWFDYEARAILQIAQAVGKPFVAEYDWKPDAALEVYAVPNLALWLAQTGYEWLTKDEWVVMRYRDPVKARRGRVSADELRRWFFKPRRRGVVEPRDMAQMARSLTADDAHALLVYLAQLGNRYQLVTDGELPSPYIVDRELLGMPHLHHGLSYAVKALLPMYEWQETFAVLETLTESQRQALIAGQAIPLRALSPPAREAVYRRAYAGDKARAPAFWQSTPPDGALRLIAREQPIRLLRLPQHLARRARDARAAARIWTELQIQYEYDWEAMYRRMGVELCCERIWLLEIVIGSQRREAVLLKDFTPLLQRDPSMRTPQ